MSLAAPTLNKLKFRAPQQLLLTSGATLIVALALGLSSTLAHDGFGQHELIPFAIYSLPFALLNGLAAGLIFKLTRRWPVWLAISSAFLVGLVFGYFAPFAVLLSLGFLFGTMSIGIWQHWCVTAALICSASVVLKRIGLTKRGARALVGLTLLSGGVWFGFVPLMSLSTDDQEHTNCFFQHHPGHTVLSLKRSATDLFNAAEVALLKQTGLRGRLERLACGQERLGAWPHARALVVLNTQDTGQTGRGSVGVLDRTGRSLQHA